MGTSVLPREFQRIGAALIEGREENERGGRAATALLESLREERAEVDRIFWLDNHIASRGKNSGPDFP
jgi:hypothetical protein